ncbi:ABC transporter ATP-binding protein [Xanthomonas sp. WHRI 1810A]|uniref:ABC transporter ATP-binding protein n=1 Tax=Xanthomonas sp. WHRI 1810A TaxID=3161565 RepID=UPI0032E8A70E
MSILLHSAPTMSAPSALALTPSAKVPLLLDVDNINVTARMGQRTSVVLRDLSFSLRPGSTLGLVGESGAGKSMIGRILSRQLPSGFEVSAGSLRFDGEDLLNVSPATHRQWLGTRIAFIPQEPRTALNPVLTIGQQLTEHLLRIGVAPQECRERSIKALEDVRLHRPASLLDSYAFELSGGMCQRVMIAMAFASLPDLVVSDEATTALDVTSQAHIVRLLRNLQERHGTAVLFVTHDMGLATHACDEVAVLYAGEIMESGPAKLIFGSTLHPYTRALRQAIPDLTGPLHTLHALKGQMPGVETFPDLHGCRFATRCEHAEPACQEQQPPLERVCGSERHRVRCLRWQDIAPHVRAQQGAHVAGQAMSALTRLSLIGLSKTWPGARSLLRRRPDVQVLKPLDLTLAPGEFVGIVGESGSGKSTLARLIMGLEHPTTGSIVLNGQALYDKAQDWDRRISSIQMIFQDARSALNPKRRIGQLLTQAMESRAHLHSERATRASDLAHDIGLAVSTLERYPTQLSGGQRQRVNIGRSLCNMPQILIADEIVSGLDVSVQAQIMNLLLELRREHKFSLLLISHDLGVVRYLCSKIVVLHQGEVVESGDTEQVLSAPQHPYTQALIAAVPPTDPTAIWPPVSHSLTEESA